MTARRRSAGVKHVTPALLRRWSLPALDTRLGKHARGHVLVIGGSNENPGAAVLAAVGALRAGAGTLQIATTRDVAAQVGVGVPEAKVSWLRATRRGEIARGAARLLRDDLASCDTVLVGPGMVDPAGATEIIARLVADKAKATLVADAGALTSFGQARPPRVRAAILTPHPGEMAKLCDVSIDEVLDHPLELARDTARRLHAVVALKGARTYVAAPDGEVWLNTAGNLGLGTSGSGDTLSGVIAGLSTRGAEPAQAAVWGVYLHARAGDELARSMGPLGFVARELLTEIPALLARLSRK